MSEIPHDIFRTASDIVLKIQKAGHDIDHEFYAAIATALVAERNRGYRAPHMCRDGHEEILHSNSERCPLCEANGLSDELDFLLNEGGWEKEK